MKTKQPKKCKEQPNRFAQVAKIVCDEYHITEDAFKSTRRFQELVNARFHYWHILYHEYGMNHSQIARAFGMTHGSVMNGLKKIEEQFDRGAKIFKARNSAIRNRLDDIEVEVTSAVD